MHVCTRLFFSPVCFVDYRRSLSHAIGCVKISKRDETRWDQRPMMVGSSAIAISSVGALSRFLFLENSMNAHPESKLQRNTIQARIREKSYLMIAPFGNVAFTYLPSNSIEDSSTCITTILQAAGIINYKLEFKLLRLFYTLQLSSTGLWWTVRWYTKLH